MAGRYGDTYSYTVLFDATGVEEIDQSTAALGRFGRATRQSASDATRSAREIAAAGQRIGLGISQAAYVFDDLSYGSKALRNQILPLTTAMFGFTPAAAALGAAGTVLVSVFGDQIDRLLATAGLLDEDLVKGLEKGKKGTDDLADSTRTLMEVLKNTTPEAEAFIDAISGQEVQRSTIEQALRAIVANEAPLRDSLRVAQFEVGELTKELQRLKDEGRNDPGDRYYQKTLARWSIAKEELAGLETDMQTFVDGRLKVLTDQLDRGGDAAANVVEQLKAIPHASPEVKAAIDAIQGAIDQIRIDKLGEAMEARRKAAEETKEFADAILEHEQELQRKQNERFEAAEAARQEEVRQILEVMAAEQEAEDERLDRVRARREQEGRARLDAEARTAAESFGSDPRFTGMIAEALRRGVAGGMSVDQAAAAARAQASGAMQATRLVGGGAADAAAEQLVREQANQARAMLNADAAQNGVTRQLLDGWDLMLQLHDRRRAEGVQFDRRAEMLRRRTEQHNRRLSPLRFMAGNPLGGFF